MLLLNKLTTRQLLDTTSTLLERVQRLEEEQAALRSRLEGERQLRVLMAHVAAAAYTAPVIGDAIERFAQAMRATRAPMSRGCAGGLARTRNAWRYSDGTFMPESEKSEAYRDEYERHAAGGRARAARALRWADGTFMPNNT